MRRAAVLWLASGPASRRTPIVRTVLTQAVCISLLADAGAPVRDRSTQDPFGWFAPCVALAARDRTRLDAGQSLARTLPERDGFVAAFGARRINADGDRLAAWVRRIEQLKKSARVPAIGRFSDPPQLADLASLALDADDLEAMRRCRQADCDLKLTAPDIARIRAAIDQAGAAWKPAAEAAFRHVVLDRLRAYIAGGQASLERYADEAGRKPPGEIFSALLARSPCLAERLPDLTAFLRRFPAAPRGSLESFFYWSKEQLGGKPTVIVTHVVIARGAGGDPRDAIVAGAQVFAAHYFNGALNLTAIVGSGPGSPHYLVVLNRSGVDVLEGFMGGVARIVVERRLRSELSEVLAQLAQRMERGLPE